MFEQLQCSLYSDFRFKTQTRCSRFSAASSRFSVFDRFLPPPLGQHDHSDIYSTRVYATDAHRCARPRNCSSTTLGPSHENGPCASACLAGGQDSESVTSGQRRPRGRREKRYGTVRSAYSVTRVPRNMRKCVL